MDDASLGDERPEKSYKRARSEDRVLTCAAVGAEGYPLQPLSSPPPETTASKKRTAGDANLYDWRAGVGIKKARNESWITPPASQTCDKALSGQSIISTANDTPKRARPFSRKSQPSSDRKAQGPSKKDSRFLTDNKRGNKGNLMKADTRDSPREERRKRRLKRVEEPRREQEHFKGNLETDRGTPRKSKLVADGEKRKHPRECPVGVKKKKDTHSSSVKIKLRNVYADEDTTETDDNTNLKGSWPRRERVNHRAQEPDTRAAGSASQNIVAPATPESCPDLESGPTFVRRDTVIGLRNLGLTCYNNAIVQALCNTPGFREYLLQNKFSWSKKKDRSSNHTRKSAATAPVRRTRQSTRIAVEKEKIPPPPDM